MKTRREQLRHLGGRDEMELIHQINTVKRLLSSIRVMQLNFKWLRLNSKMDRPIVSLTTFQCIFCRLEKKRGKPSTTLNL